MRQQFQWKIGSRTLELGKRTRIMGVVNVTPDSFFGGGRHYDSGAAVDHALRLFDEGADLVDIGGESTRPGALVSSGTSKTPEALVSADEELRRVLPVIEGVKRLRPEAIVSVDTHKAAVAQTTVEAGAEVVNDVSGLLWDPEMSQTLAALKCGVVIMHVRGLPREWRSLPPLANVAETVRRELGERAEAGVAAGIEASRIVLDPGFGFGKNYEENYPLLARFEELVALGFPLMAGTSRKSFLGKAIRRDAVAPPEERLFASVTAAVLTIVKGAHIVRVHDVRATADAVALIDAVAQSAG